ncbi:MAG: type II secretion system F family protein [Planctomycetales bacterium]|nr:type II secretion system F family protein [Planctomycetales bacterium]
MPEYSYVATNQAGAIERGRIEGTGPSDAQAKLMSRGRRLVGLKESSSLSIRGIVLRALTIPIPILRRRRLRSIHAELLLQQLAVMLGSGLELTPSLRELSRYSMHPSQQRLCAELADAVEQGQSFSESLIESKSFSPVVAQLVKVGEQTGELATTLSQAVEFLEARRQTMGTLIAALAYPCAVAVAALSVAFYLVVWAIPKLAVFLHAMGRRLPMMTQSLLDIADLVQRYGLTVLVLGAACLLAFVATYLTERGRFRLDQSMLRIPIVGTLLQMAATQQFASSLALMLKTGVFLPDALETVAALHRNRFLSSVVVKSRERLSVGENLSGAFSGFGFSRLLSSMIAVGERTGDLPRALEQVASFYAGQLKSRLQTLGRLVEPAIIVVVGGIVGYVYVAFFMALISAGGNLK